MRITFKKRRETGLRAVCSGPPSSDINIDGKREGSVSALTKNHRVLGWYFCVHGGAVNGTSPHINTCDKPVATEEKAKAAAKAWIKKQAEKKA
jgi:hypothetical protein